MPITKLILFLHFHFWKVDCSYRKNREFSSVGSEHLPYKQGVTGSNPVTPTNLSHNLVAFFMSCFFYILFSKEADRYYIGHTSNIEERVRKHNTHHKGFTGKYCDWIIAFCEEYPSKELAYKRERQVKRWKSRKLIEKLIARGSEHPD